MTSRRPATVTCRPSSDVVLDVVVQQAAPHPVGDDLVDGGQQLLGCGHELGVPSTSSAEGQTRPQQDAGRQGEQPVPARAPISAGPRPPVSTVRAGGTASGAASSPNSAHGRPTPTAAMTANATTNRPAKSSRVAPVAEQDRQGPLADELRRPRCRAGC